MRMMMKVQIPTAAGNRANTEGRLPGVIQEAMERLRPEAAYFFPEGGMRTALFVFDLPDPSQLPVIAEPFFQAAEASIDFRPVMNAEDLQTGLSQIRSAQPSPPPPTEF